MTDYTTIPEYKISWEECDKITAHTLKFYKTLVNTNGATHADDWLYNTQLTQCIDFILDYLGEANDN